MKYTIIKCTNCGYEEEFISNYANSFICPMCNERSGIIIDKSSNKDNSKKEGDNLK